MPKKFNIIKMPIDFLTKVLKEVNGETFFSINCTRKIGEPYVNKK